ncbi:MAG: YdcF family protein [Candidatus Acidiferrales bacterium]
MNQHGGIISRLIALIALAFVLLLLWVIRAPLLRAAGQFWIVDDAPQPSDAIIVLSDDNYWGDRATRAAELFHDGWSSRVVASGRLLRANTSMAEIMDKDLIAHGVPEQNIIHFTHRSDSTLEEALALRGLIRQRGWSKVIVVTSNYHTRRTRYICQRVFTKGVDLRVIAARDREFDSESWWTNRKGRKLFLHESLGLLWALWEVNHLSPSQQAAVIFGSGTLRSRQSFRVAQVLQPVN